MKIRSAIILTTIFGSLITFTAASDALAQGGNWTTKAPMSTSREWPAGGATDELLYVAGGAYNGAYLATAEVYDPVTNTWTALPAMATTRESPSGAVLN